MEPFQEKEPKFSIVTISHNEASSLRAHIESVLAQEYENFEHIIIDRNSTDETQTLLREFPHLIWTSEDFDSEASQLNEGNKKVTGDIVGFFRGSDVLSPKIFGGVVEALQTEMMVMGNFQLVDSDGNEKATVKNFPRSYSDILKYWVYGSTPAFHGCFFRNAMLNAHTPTELFSSDFQYAHEYDLSLRIGGCMPFSNHQDLLFVKRKESGDDPERSAKLYREASRIFRRVGIKRAKAERRVSVIIACDQMTDNLESTLQSCAKQTLADFEIVPWWVGSDQSLFEELSRFTSDLSSISNDGRYRDLIGKDQENQSFQARYKELVSAVRSPLILMIFPGQLLKENAVLEVVNSFEQDSLGALFLCGGDQQLSKHLLIEKDGAELFNVQALFQPISQPRCAAFRTIALQEVLECELSESDEALALRELYLLFQYKAWSVQVEKEGVVNALSEEAVSACNPESLSAEFLQAKLIDRLATVRVQDSFAELRSKHGFIIEFPDETVSAAREFLKKQSDG